MSDNTVDNRKAADQQKVAAMRRLLAEGGERAVEKRFGESALNSAELARAQKQRQANAQRAAEVRRKATAQVNEQGERPRQGGKESALERVNRIMKQQEEREERSRSSLSR